MKSALLLVALAVLLALPARAEPDEIVRTLLGVGSLPVRFTPERDGQIYYQLAVAKFQDGKFTGYCDFPMATDSFGGDRASNAPKEYRLELAWAKREGQAGFIVRASRWTQGFMADSFFEHPLGLTHYFALGQPPQQKLGPFLVLGLAVGGEATPPPEEEDVKAWLRRYPRAVVFLAAPFDSGEQAHSFAKAMPTLSTD